MNVRLVGMCGSALILATSLVTTDARADEHVGTTHRSASGYRAGVALTATGLSFLVTGFVGAGITLGFMASSPADGGPTLGGFAIAGSLLGGCTVIGLSTLIPGMVLMNYNKPVTPRTDDIVRDARGAPPLPRFTSVPILAGTF